MSTDKKITLGLFGFGVVGQGIYNIIQQNPSLNIQIKKIAIKNIDKQRIAPHELFTNNGNDILFDDEIDIIAEAIDDAEVAFSAVSTALQNKKPVVSANKKMIATNLSALVDLQKKHNTSLLYEASVCASIPIVRVLDTYYSGNLLSSLQAIVNGSTNYILTKMFEEKLSFNNALKQAQELGYAESNPKLDVNGYDALYKLTELLTHTFGVVAKPENILFSGIQNINDADAAFAKQNEKTIKLIAKIKKQDNGKITAFVLPHFVSTTTMLANVKDANNAVLLGNSYGEFEFLYGKGAGSYPTALAIINDVFAIQKKYNYNYDSQEGLELDYNETIKAYIRFEGNINKVEKYFESIDKKFISEQYNYVIGKIKLNQFVKTDWWQQEGISLIMDE
jgi:homoserine dehydrogenase